MGITDRPNDKMTFRMRKRNCRKLLIDRNYGDLVKMAESDAGISRALMSLLFDKERLICWRAAEGLGLVCGMEYDRDKEGVRQILRRLFWTMNDESGNLGWYSPQAIGEILYNTPELMDEFGVMLASFVIEEPFEFGVRLAINRAGEKNPEPFKHIVPKIIDTLRSKDAAMRGSSLLALDRLGAEIPIDIINDLKEDSASIEMYDFTKGELITKEISEIAENIK